MISTEFARRLRDAGLHWHPAPGDAFRIDRAEFEQDVFTVSDMTIEAHEFDTGTILGFNGTTEWALDSVALEDSLWLPRENQLRDLLGGTFRSLTRIASRDGAVTYRVETSLGGTEAGYEAEEVADAYARALLVLIEASGPG